MFGFKFPASGSLPVILNSLHWAQIAENSDLIRMTAMAVKTITFILYRLY